MDHSRFDTCESCHRAEGEERDRKDREGEILILGRRRHLVRSVILTIAPDPEKKKMGRKCAEVAPKGNRGSDVIKGCPLI